MPNFPFNSFNVPGLLFDWFSLFHVLCRLVFEGFMLFGHSDFMFHLFACLSYVAAAILAVFRLQILTNRVLTDNSIIYWNSDVPFLIPISWKENKIEMLIVSVWTACDLCYPLFFGEWWVLQPSLKETFSGWDDNFISKDNNKVCGVASLRSGKL